jgi:hypothetical protein
MTASNGVTMFRVEQEYTQQMAQYFNPLQVVAQVLDKIEINPYAIKSMDVKFVQGERDIDYNRVRLTIEMDYEFPSSWIEYMKHEIQGLLQAAFHHSYGKKHDESWYSKFDKEPPFWGKEFDGDEIRPS